MTDVDMVEFRYGRCGHDRSETWSNSGMADLGIIDSHLTDRKRQVDRNFRYLVTLNANRDGIQMT